MVFSHARSHVREEDKAGSDGPPTDPQVMIVAHMFDDYRGRVVDLRGTSERLMASVQTGPWRSWERV
jgi:hypothetical protein